jgi:hypothetical protein
MHVYRVWTTPALPWPVAAVADSLQFLSPSDGRAAELRSFEFCRSRAVGQSQISRLAATERRGVTMSGAQMRPWGWKPTHPPRC